MYWLGPLLPEVGWVNLFAYQVKVAQIINKKLAYSFKLVLIHSKIDTHIAQQKLFEYTDCWVCGTSVANHKLQQCVTLANPSLGLRYLLLAVKDFNNIHLKQLV